MRRHTHLVRVFTLSATICSVGIGLPCTVSAQSPPIAASSDTRPFVVERVGSGRPMILIPGLLSGGEVWNGTVERFKGSFEMHVLTLAGFAGVAPLQGDVFLQTERDAIIRYIRERRLEKPVIVGHSLGGFLAFWIAATAPDLVGPVVAVDGVPYLPTLRDTTMTPAKARPYAEQMRAMSATLTAEQLAMQTAMVLRAQAKDSVHAAMGARWGRTSDGATMGRAVAEMMTTDLRQNVASIRSPVLLIAAGDGLTEVQRNEVLARYKAQVANIPNHRVIMALNARHFVMLDDPGFLFAAMNDFLIRP